jgi:hypothetical protein
MNELSPRARDLIRETRGAEELSAEAKSRVLDAVHAKLATGTLSAAMTAWYVLGALAAVGGAIALVAWALSAPNTSPRERSVVSQVELANEQSAPSIETSPSEATPAPARTTAIRARPPASPVAPRARDRSAMRRATRSETRASPAEDAVVIESVVREADEPPLAPTQSVEESAPESPVVRSSLAEETEMLRAAHRALAHGAPGEARSILEDHARRFPDGVLALERDATRWVALCAIDPTPGVVHGALGFLRMHPHTMHEERIRRVCRVPGNSL